MFRAAGSPSQTTKSMKRRVSLAEVKASINPDFPAHFTVRWFGRPIGDVLTPAACAMGNPHCTFFVDDAEAVDLEALGAATEHDPLFPERTNVQVVQVLDRNTARVRVWERGVGRTLASGSSSCAVVVNAHRRGLMDRSATLRLDGGDIRITWADDGHVLMAGPVAYVFEGVFAPAVAP